MSTEDASPKTSSGLPFELKLADLLAIGNAAVGARDPRDDQIAELQEHAQRLENDLLEQRFLYSLAFVVLLDCYVFMHIPNLAGPIIIGLLEIVGLIIYARKCRVDAVAPLIDKFLGAFSGFNSKPKAESSNSPPPPS